jgi:hypothetical protein
MKLTDKSSFRKLARAIRQGKVPPERQVVIDQALEKAEKRKTKYRKVKS